MLLMQELLSSVCDWRIAAACAVATGSVVIGGLRLRARAAREARLTTAINYMTQGLVMFDSAERIVVCNERYLQMYGLSPAIVRPGCHLIDLLKHRAATGKLTRDPHEYRRHLLDRLRNEKLTKFIVEAPDGCAVEVTNKLMADGGWVVTHDDITEQLQRRRELEQTRGFLDTIVENIPSSIVVKDARDHSYVLINKAYEAFFGVSRTEMVGKRPADFLPADMAAEIVTQDDRLVAAGGLIVVDEHPVPTQGNVIRIAHSKKLLLPGPAGDAQYILSVIEDVTEKRAAEDKIAHLAHYDALTDLPNRAAFNTKLEAVLRHARGEKQTFAVLFVDLDGFKEINDVFGHAAGDGLLCQIAERFRAAAQGQFVARLGGDEFVVIAVGGEQPASAEALAGHLLQATKECVVAEQELRVNASIGLAVFPRDGTEASTLLANADAALYRAKGDGRNAVRTYDFHLDGGLRERRALQNELQTALTRDELILHYQPLASLDREIVGFEALVRWEHPYRGMLGPGEFIPVAEASGQIVALGEWVLREACSQAAKWARPLRIAVNLSAVQFRQGDLVSVIHAILLETGLAPSRLELEVTESVLIGDFSRAISILRRLKSMGVRIAMDDFGTGYSSLSYLQSCPFDTIKIDRSFVADLEHNHHSRTIVRAVLGIARELKLPVIAEGVETEGQLAILAQESCDEVQGFLIGRPAPLDFYDHVTSNADADIPVQGSLPLHRTA